MASWLRHFREEMAPLVQAARQRQHMHQSKRRGRSKQPFVTGYVIGDDSTEPVEGTVTHVLLDSWHCAKRL